MIALRERGEFSMKANVTEKIFLSILLLFTSCANAVNNEKDAANKLLHNIKESEKKCQTQRYPLISQIVQCQYSNAKPIIESYDQNLVPPYTRWRDEHLSYAYEYESIWSTSEFRFYKSKFDLQKSEIFKAIEAVEPRSEDKGSEFYKVSIKSIQDANCNFSSQLSGFRCVKAALSPIWMKYSPTTFDFFNKKYDEIFEFAREFDENTQGILKPALSKFNELHIQSNKKLADSFNAVVAGRISVATANDAQSRENARSVAQGVAAILGAAVVVGAAAAEGYAAGAGARSAPTPSNNQISCTSNKIGTYTYINCY